METYIRVNLIMFLKMAREHPEITRRARQYDERRRQILERGADAEEIRAKLLDLREGEKIKLVQYFFSLPKELVLKNDDREDVYLILEEFGERIYGDRKSIYSVIEGYYWGGEEEEGPLWDVSELLWPLHEKGFIDLVAVQRSNCEKEPSQVWVWFNRGEDYLKNPLNRAALYARADSIYKTIEKKLI